jgi:hypothetical protein
MTSYFEAAAVNGPKVAAWLEQSGYVPERPEVFDAAMARNLRKWRAGVWPPVETVDRVCVLLGVTWSELPDDVWEEAVPDDFPPRSCAICGVDMPRRRRARSTQPDSWETRNEYVSTTTCSHECGVTKAVRARKAKHG